jgi:hypothetical protein
VGLHSAGAGGGARQGHHRLPGHLCIPVRSGIIVSSSAGQVEDPQVRCLT